MALHSDEAATSQQLRRLRALRPVLRLEDEAGSRNFATCLEELGQALAAPLDEEPGNDRVLVVAFAMPVEVGPDAGESVPANRDPHGGLSTPDSVSENAAGSQTQRRPPRTLESERNSRRRTLSLEDVWQEVSKQVHTEIRRGMNRPGP